jgi:hypothetical protein
MKLNQQGPSSFSGRRLPNDRSSDSCLELCPFLSSGIHGETDMPRWRNSFPHGHLWSIRFRTASIF